MATPVLQALLRWLRAGYPDGVPTTDYFPLLALLGRELTTEQVTEIVEHLRDSGALASEGELTRTDIGAAIMAVTADLPSEDDLRRVADRLTRGGHAVSDEARGLDG